MRPTDQEMTDVENVTCFSQFPRGGGSSGQAGPPGKHQGQQGRWGVEESREESLARAFAEVSRSQINQLEFFLGALELGGCLWLSGTWCWGLEQVESALE